MIVDTSVVVAIMQGEPEAERLVRAILTSPPAKISAATLVEVYAVLDVRGQPAQSRRVDHLLAELRLQVVPFDDEQALAARDAYRDFGRGSGTHAKLNLGDVFSYALASVTGEPLLFVGDDFTHTDLIAADY